MKSFLLRLIMCLAVPIGGILAVYIITDPYKTLKPFSLEYFDDTNRDYLSSELYLMNYHKYKYDSFIFGSSRCCGLNTYQWLQYLPAGSSQFLFQAWGETITGIEQKITYIDKIGERINNAIVVLDIPGAFGNIQTPKTALGIKNPTISGQSRLAFQSILFWNFLQKPSQWIMAVKKCLTTDEQNIGFDPVSNDWEGLNKFMDFSCPPQKDSLKNCSEISRNAFIRDNEWKADKDIPESQTCITDVFQEQLLHIRYVFEKQHTHYKIVISPAFCYTFPKISSDDYSILVGIFGKGNVYDFSGKNYLTADYNNFSDPNHFGQYVGWYMMHTICVE